MASEKSIALKNADWRERARVWNNNRKNPRKPRYRDRSLRGKDRIRARKAANRS